MSRTDRHNSHETSGMLCSQVDREEDAHCFLLQPPSFLLSVCCRDHKTIIEPRSAGYKLPERIGSNLLLTRCLCEAGAQPVSTPFGGSRSLLCPSTHPTGTVSGGANKNMNLFVSFFIITTFGDEIG